MPTITSDPQQSTTEKAKDAVVDEKKRLIRLITRIEKELPREAGQTVIAKHVYNDRFRVNWYLNEESDLTITHRIVKSQFIKASLGEDDELKMEDITLKSGGKLAEFL